MALPTSPVTAAQLIHQIILSTDTTTPDYLQLLVYNIDNLLSHYTSKGKERAANEKVDSVRARLPSASDVADFSEEVSQNVKLISDQISKSTGDKHGTAISVLNAVGNVHWVGVGFLLVAAVIETLDKIKQNKKECLKLLKSMNDLAKLILQLQRFPHLKEEMLDKMKDSIQLIVEGAILCCVQRKRKLLRRLWIAGKDGEQLVRLRSQVDEMGRMLHSQISLSTLDVVHSNVVCSQPPIPSHNSSVVGIDHKITEVIQLLEWDNDNPVVAVVVHGIGGAGKTTLANEVFASLNLQSWKYSKVTLVKNLELNPNIEEIQSQILSDLTGIKHDTVRDFQDGQQGLKSIMEKEAVFIYIDNILRRQHLEDLLPKLTDSPKKVRILVTARKTNISGVFESCRFKPCKLYSIESLSVEAALEVLCRNIDGERDTDTMVEERPQAKKIAEKCSCCPLFLEVVGAYLHKRNNVVEAYEKVVGWLSDGQDDFSCDKEDGFEESRILFAYHELTPSAQEAFLDICSFFYDWGWNEVACIVGEEELVCLLEGALVKRTKYYYDDSILESINIHDLILTAGRSKSKGNRFTSVDDFSITMENEKDLDQIKGVWLKENYKLFHVSAKLLDAMSLSLRVFAMGNNTIVSGECSKRFDELRFLQAEWVLNFAIDTSKLRNLSFLDFSFKEHRIWSISENLSSLKVLKLNRSEPNDGANLHAAMEFGHLIKLKHLHLRGFHIKEVANYVKVYSLEKLRLLEIQGLKKVPWTIGKLRSLKELYLGCCDDLMQFTEGFGELSSLSVLGLSGCKSLEELPCDFKKLLSLQLLNLSNCTNLLRLPDGLENLPSLKFIDVRGCSKITGLSHRVCELSFWKSRMSFSGCSSLIDLPEEICRFTTLRNLSLERCKSLTVLPIGFGQLSCLEELVLDECECLQELTDDFHCLASLRGLRMCGCKSLSRLPEGFGKLSCLERLELSGCDNIQELSSDFGCLGALEVLKLSRCKSLSKLPDCFGQLGRLQSLDLSICSMLAELSSNFHCLTSLIELDLSNCESLREEWMDKVVSVQSLWRLSISRSEKLIERWTEMRREKEDWHFVVLTDPFWQETRRGRNAVLLNVMVSKIFDEEGLLIDNNIHGRPFYSSSLRPASSLIFIIRTDDSVNTRKSSRSQIDGRLFEKSMQQLESNSRSTLSIIYAGRHFNALPWEVTEKIQAYTPSSSKTDMFFDKVSATFPELYGRATSVFRTSRDGFEVKGVKCPSVWEDVSYILNEAAFLASAPRESNVEILRALLETDFLLKKNQQVKIIDLQGKVILLLHTKPMMRMIPSYLALNDMYTKMQGSHEDRVEVVWVGLCDEGERTMFERVAADAPWPVLPNPWLIKQSLEHFFTSLNFPWSRARVMVVDGKGRISNKNALEMIERWGVEAFPFSEAREEELRKLEWETAAFNCKKFVFQNLPFTQTKVEGGLHSCGEISVLFVGLADQMMSFGAELEDSLSKLESHFPLYYIWHKIFSYKADEETKMKQKSSIPSISQMEAYRFWQRMKYLYDDLTRMGSEEKIVRVRKLVSGIISAESRCHMDWKIQVIVVDEKGEMVSGEAKEVVEALLHCVENRSSSPTEIVQCLEAQRKDGIIHSKHHPHHVMLPISLRYGSRSCSICSKNGVDHYQCNVCENHVMCNECIVD